MHLFSNFVILYPLIVSIVWITGAIFFGILQHQVPLRRPSEQEATPLVSVLIPAHNEETTLHEVVESVSRLTYQHIELILIDDGSSDETLNVMRALQTQYAAQLLIKVVPVKQNGGKANALNVGLDSAEGEYLLCLDSDSYIDQDALSHMMLQFYNDDKIGAVAGRPVVRNRTTLLGRLQLLEYIGIIDIIKRGQAFITGHITTVSGVIVVYRKRAVKEVNRWTVEALTEDIDMTWKLYTKHWRVAYCPQAVSWILVPEHLKALIKQRRRWARGGLEVLVRNRQLILNGRLAEQWLLVDMVISNAWALCCTFAVLMYFLTMVFAHVLILDGGILFVLTLISIVQFIIGFTSSQRQGYVDWQDLLLLPMYFVFYWVVNLVSCITALGSFFIDPKRKGVWASPDRGV
ncbi:family 2 glycosyl transferase [Secundilactobacillus odoratitofui DSM 19909 = JCM 15043]|uniref:Family 2 glycosyl transferase n=1 Tax=Secundilactobacillus odoratitofui DSM 19909 = JCM 15043 TaxID=1423776 RepID=A0A0R1LZD6_9LACO|nr:glycosyltransferase [Secundilactobacillus odoratitofui]KRK97850.1 family 2 glycosyl transferase [Secundilactobacillus odoratitofui DSM 19909 = JCM 15043]